MATSRGIRTFGGVKRNRFIIFILLGFFILSGLDAFSQCAMCKSAAESNLKANPKSIARSLNAGILYLMAVPYLAILFIFRKQVYKLWKIMREKVSA